MNKKHVDFPSRYDIDEQVLFSPNIGIATFPALIKGISFGVGKVYYDLLLTDVGIYLYRVDSLMVFDVA